MNPENFSRSPRRTLLNAMVATSGLALTGKVVQASEAFPTKPIRIMYPFPAGGGMEVVLRVMVAEMPKTLGQPVVIENRTGGTGAIALQAALSAPADGNHIFVGPVAPMALLPQVRQPPLTPSKVLIYVDGGTESDRLQEQPCFSPALGRTICIVDLVLG